MKLFIFTEKELEKCGIKDKEATTILDIQSLKEQAEEDFIYGEKVGKGVSEVDLVNIQSDDFVSEFLRGVSDGGEFALARIIHNAYQDRILESKGKI